VTTRELRRVGQGDELDKRCAARSGVEGRVEEKRENAPQESLAQNLFKSTV
jgi:hypothetical protein